jgi:predicted phosphodiesterase
MLLWLTDIHLNFLRPLDTCADQFAKYLMEENPSAEGLIISGDISSGEVLKDHLIQLAKRFTKPIYMVTGNHDYYKNSFAEIDKQISELTKEYSNLHWLNEGNCYLPKASIVGVGGFYDVRIGNAYSCVCLSDFELIEDLVAGYHYRDLLIELVRKRADKEAQKLDLLLQQEIVDIDADLVIVVTHVSPFCGSSWHEGKISNRDWLPWFSSKATGDVIEKYAESFPEKRFVVLSGHGHSPGIYKHSDNLVVYSGKAKYYVPDLAGTINFDTLTINTFDSDGARVERKL